MRDEEAHAAEEGWSWVRGENSYLHLGGCLTFVRGVSPEGVLEGFGMEVATAQLLPLSRAREALPFLESDAHGNVLAPWVRVGQVHDWAFAIEAPTLVGELELVGARLSAGTEAIVVAWTAKPTYSFSCYVDESAATMFEPGMVSHRGGGDPDRFLAEIRRVGLTERPPPRELERQARIEARRGARRDRVRQMLAIMTLAYGIRISKEMAHGPLLTCQRRPDLPEGP